MPEKTSYSYARQNLAKLWDAVEDSREAAVIQRRGHEDIPGFVPNLHLDPQLPRGIEQLDQAQVTP